MSEHAKARALTCATLGLAVGAAAAYPLWWRDRCLHWGATEEESGRALPGDELLGTPDIVSTRAVTVSAPAAAVWPWLVQMGPGRAGAYTYDWVENLLGLDMHSADVIVPAWQNLREGDGFELGKHGGPRLRVETLTPEHALVLRSADGNWVWAFVLDEADGVTRLISRNRIAVLAAPLPVRLVNLLVMEPGSLVMERKMLLGIKQRAERTAAGVGPDTKDHRQRRWGPMALRTRAGQA